MSKAKEIDQRGINLLDKFGNNNKGMQAHLMALIIHVHHHGADVANNFLAQCELRKETLREADVKVWREWLLAHGQLAWSAPDKKFLTDRTKETLKDDSAKNLWWKWKKPKADVEYNYVEAIRKIQKAAQGQLNKRDNLVNEGQMDAASLIDVDRDTMQAINLILGKVIDPKDVIAMVQSMSKAA